MVSDTTIPNVSADGSLALHYAAVLVLGALASTDAGLGGTAF